MIDKVLECLLVLLKTFEKYAFYLLTVHKWSETDSKRALVFRGRWMAVVMAAGSGCGCWRWLWLLAVVLAAGSGCGCWRWLYTTI